MFTTTSTRRRKKPTPCRQVSVLSPREKIVYAPPMRRSEITPPLPTTIKPTPIHRVLVIAPVSPHAGACHETTPLEKEGSLFLHAYRILLLGAVEVLLLPGKPTGSATWMRCATQASPRTADEGEGRAQPASLPAWAVLREARRRRRRSMALW